ncbi:MAG TPA: RNase adapter RapZ, partial [Steroidobacteraceae bacterium]|nr:RNase adapter RapZ [Steroidobacteraceae bacterium]
GCTGGQHRSVYLVDKLAQKLAANHTAVTVRHNSLAAGTHGKIQVISAPRS